MAKIRFLDNVPFGVFNTNQSNGGGSGTFSGSFIGDLQGTASWAIVAVTASYFSGSISNAVSSSYSLSSSYALTASYALNGGNGGTTTGSFTGSFTGSLLGTASYATSASYAPNTGVTKIIAGSNIFINPIDGIGNVSINSIPSVTANSGSNVVESFTSQSVWLFEHNLGNKYVIIQTFDENHNTTIPEEVQLTSTSSVTITFPTSESGYAIASLGGALSSSYSNVSYFSTTSSYSIYSENSLSSSYSITSSYSLGTKLPSYKIVSSSYTISTEDNIIEVITAYTTQSLPSAAGIPGKTYNIINASSGSIMIITNGSETIGNNYTSNNSFLIIFMEDAPQIVSNNSNWRLI